MSEPSPLFIVAVAALVTRGNTVLAMRRSAHKDAGPGLWETLSGRVNHDEDPLAAVRREINEETGLEVAVEPRPLSAYPARRNGEPMVVIIYRAHHLAGEVQLSDEHDAYAWLDADTFAERSPLTELVAAVRQVLAEEG